ncbi:MAG: bifunctional phosphoribosylaminoimidazolecarboxamide formyltransferase/IMP cyclohydrolase PurH, partial [Flavobacteriales bacterium]
FNVTSHYDIVIADYFNKGNEKDEVFRKSYNHSKELRYGENPHQIGKYFGNMEELFDQVNGKELSYNNLLDIEAAIRLMKDIGNNHPFVAIFKHNNACGAAIHSNLNKAWENALSGDPESAFGGVIIMSQKLTKEVAEKVNEHFYEVLIAPSFDNDALELLKSKKKRIILKLKKYPFERKQFRTILNGVLQQTHDTFVESENELEFVTKEYPDRKKIQDLLMANIIVKHTRSNAIILWKNGKLIGSGVGQTSRVDALRHAIEKAKRFGHNLNDSVMASDAFFPFSDCVEIAHKEGVKSVIQPGGSIRDEESIEYCNNNQMNMVFTGHRHFKH